MRWRLSIPRLEDMRLGNRIMLTFAIVVIVLILLACVGYMSGRWEAQGEAVYPPLEHSAYDERLSALDREAIEVAYKNRITALFETWMKDATGQPMRALTGARQARRAYVGSMNAIEQRK